MKKTVILALLPVVGAFAALSTPAEAKVRLTVNSWGLPYFQYYTPNHRRHAVPPPDAYGSSYYDDYGDPAFDESYYDPYYLPPSPKPLPLKKKKPQQASVKPKAKPVAAAAKPPMVKQDAQAGSKPLTTASLAPAPSAPAGKSAAVSCDKAGGIVAGYGFSSVKPQDCDGQVYEFAAMRDGKKFLIKVSAASGELTEVKKAD